MNDPQVNERSTYFIHMRGTSRDCYVSARWQGYTI